MAKSYNHEFLSQIRTQWLTKSFGNLLVRPSLWYYTLRFIVWKPFPHIPINYIKFRFVTMYGSNYSPTDTMDLVRYLEWVKNFLG